jgi:hypothetical protein
MDDEWGHLLNHTECQRLEDSIWVKPIINIYPGQDIGKAYSEDIYSAYYDYENQLHGQPDNPYAPFLSKMDWEFARWSKLQGPGSTSASELMAIDGVRLNFQQISCLRLVAYQISYSFKNDLDYHIRVRENLIPLLTAF